MTDLILISAIPITIIVLVGVYQVAQLWLQRPDCEHSYSDWQHFTETPTAYTQTRVCKYCKYIQTLQERKL